MFRRMLFLVPVAAIAVGGSTACATKKFVRTSVGQVNDKGDFFEIDGHPDSVGDKTYNEKLGLERAEAVKRYLYESHQIPLHKMNVISYGEDTPVAETKTKVGRAQNRRVVIRVLV